MFLGPIQLLLQARLHRHPSLRLQATLLLAANLIWPYRKRRLWVCWLQIRHEEIHQLRSKGPWLKNLSRSLIRQIYLKNFATLCSKRRIPKKSLLCNVLRRTIYFLQRILPLHTIWTIRLTRSIISYISSMVTKEGAILGIMFYILDDFNPYYALDASPVVIFSLVLWYHSRSVCLWR